MAGNSENRISLWKCPRLSPFRRTARIYIETSLSKPASPKRSGCAPLSFARRLAGQYTTQYFHLYEAAQLQLSMAPMANLVSVAAARSDCARTSGHRVGWEA